MCWNRNIVFFNYLGESGTHGIVADLLLLLLLLMLLLLPLLHPTRTHAARAT